MQSKLDFWPSISDMMSGLMLVFLFVAVLFMMRIEEKQKGVEDLAEKYKEAQQEIHESLKDEFSGDLKAWDAKLLDDNTIRFSNPDVLFKKGSSKLRPGFQNILKDFLPRYFKLLQAHSDAIEEVRIEGHTSTKWGNASSLKDRYLNNLKLSQARTLAILIYAYQLKTLSSKDKDWLTKIIRANGLAFAKPLYQKNGKEDFIHSRRVEFRALPKANQQIDKILKQLSLKGDKTPTPALSQ